MVAKVKETLSKSAALKAGKDNDEKEDLVRAAKVEKLKKVPHACSVVVIHYVCMYVYVHVTYLF